MSETAAKTHCHGPVRHAETVFGWNRQAVASGIRETEAPPAKSGTEQETRGRAPLEETHAELVTQADKLLGAQAQVDPKFQTETLYTRMTGESLRAALAESLDIPISRLPAPRTLRRFMNRRGFSLKKVRKTIPQKKIPQTDAIFENVRAAHLRAENEHRNVTEVGVDYDLEAAQRGKKLTKSQMKTLSQRLQRLTGLERWCVMTRPAIVPLM